MRWVKGAAMVLTCGLIATLSWLATRPRDTPADVPAAAPPTTGTATASPGPPDGVPENMLGRWKGSATGPGGASDLELELTRGTRGQTVGESGIGSAGCSFGVVLEATEPDAILFSEKLKSGGACVGVSGRLSLRGQTLRYSALTEDGDVVVGELRRA